MQQFNTITSKGFFNKSGIYIIYIKHHSYVGSSINLYNRLKEHHSKLKRNVHYNNFLQNCYNKYGEDNLYFGILRYIKGDKYLRIFEKYFIDNLKPDINYQICPINYTVSDFTKLKISQSLKRKYSNGEIDICNRKIVYMYDINGKYINKYPSVRDCSVKNNLQSSKIGNCISGNRKSTGGFQFSTKYVPKMKKIISNSNHYKKYKQSL